MIFLYIAILSSGRRNVTNIILFWWKTSLTNVGDSEWMTYQDAN